ncbi:MULTISPECIES: hypothetical protein [Pseudomonas]|uniref:hypothetical protein n=1 Tax=Pseudomonas TaxID=286 RepID=UPI000B8BBE50|nr:MULTISPECIES: hypothetical protein [Pseudomonas]OXS23028.1 hypothetical protein CGU36_04120 [Pseudomonas fluorescens]KAF6697206.1 hypothetical protein HFD98_02535 [Pseudomonas sp. EKM23D]OZO47457.1 hypothetical protein CGU37_19235 [Pseudomonas fluorescens]QKJ71008.1 hypothetical protein HRH33_09080 [Pseudomonas rhodesiae]TGY19867.1 hypothetical protein E5845_03515 [Pseudomonas fluorescens]
MEKSIFSIVTLLCLVILPINAFAYLDPGTGSAMLQGILGALAAIAMVMKLYWHRLLRMLGLRKDVMKKETDTEKK